METQDQLAETHESVIRTAEEPPQALVPPPLNCAPVPKASPLVNVGRAPNANLPASVRPAPNFNVQANAGSASNFNFPANIGPAPNGKLLVNVGPGRHIDLSVVPRCAPPPKKQLPPGRLVPVPRRSNSPERESKTIQFRFRTRFIRATATQIDHVHRNVMRLHLAPSKLQSLLNAVLSFLPSSAKGWFEWLFPEWCLPSQVIFKKYKDGWDEEFQSERKAYARLKPLQGIVVPKLYGELTYHEPFSSRRALLLSDIGDACVATAEGALLSVPDFRRQLHQTLTTLSHFKVYQDDVKLDNFHLVGDKIVMVDLERLQGENVSYEIGVDGTVKWLADLYEDHQYCLWKDGHIKIERQD
ncbi:hypothetical protein VTH06DRAFT_979 [Thermothelomyces fergusii]